MTVNRGVAAHELAGGIRTLIEQRGLSLRALGKLAGVSPANLSNWQTGDRLIPEDKLVNLLKAAEATDEERERLLGLRRQAGAPDQLAVGPASIGEQLTRLIVLERQARRIIAVAPTLIPGLLQTSDYARATLGSHDDVDTLVALRMGRKEVLRRSRNPVELLAIISTEALTKPIVPPLSMADQLRHLLEMAALPNVTIQLVSSTVPGYNVMYDGKFILFELTADDVLHLENYGFSVSIGDKEVVRSYAAAAEEIRKMAMTPERSTGVIGDLLDGLEKTV